MCKSHAEGGQRCAAHTRPRYEAAAAALHKRAPDDSSRLLVQRAWDRAATEHASTAAGAEEMRAEAEEADRTGQVDRAAAIRACLRGGQAMRAAAADLQSRAVADPTGQQAVPVDRQVLLEALDVLRNSKGASADPGLRASYSRKRRRVMDALIDATM